MISKKGFDGGGFNDVYNGLYRFWEHLKNFPLVFIKDPGDLTTGKMNLETFLTGNDWITLHPTCNSPGERTRQIDTILRLLENEKIIPNWRNEVAHTNTTLFIYIDLVSFFNIITGHLESLLGKLCWRSDGSDIKT